MARVDNLQQAGLNHSHCMHVKDHKHCGLQDVNPQEDFILVIDADMIMRQPFDPVALGAGPGWAISAYFTYMKGVNNELAMRHVPQVKLQSTASHHLNFCNDIF